MLQCYCPPQPTSENVPTGRKARKLARRATDKKSVVAAEAKKNSSKLNERSGNVYENKGPLWKTRGRSRNVYEKKVLNRL